MKKRLLGLALALVMIISLLPLTASAAAMPKFRMYDNVINPDGSTHYIEKYFNASSTVYVVFEDVLDTDGTTVLGNKPVIATEVPTDNYVKFAFVDGVAEVTLKNVHYKRTATAGVFISVYKNGGDYTDEFDSKLILEGTNTLEGANVRFSFSQKGDTTITGSGSLTVNTALNSCIFFQTKQGGKLLIKDTTLNINTTSGDTGTLGGFVADGPIAIEGSNVEFTGEKSYALTTGTKASTALDDTTIGITISKGSNVKLVTGSIRTVLTKGPFVIDNASAEINKGTGNKTNSMYAIPTITGCSSVQYGSKSTAMKDLDLAAGTDLSAADGVCRYFKAVHTCTAQADDGDCTTAVTCACGKEATPAKQHAGVVTDCTKDTLCTNAGCTKVYAAKLGTAHTPAADDGDCTTDIKCANCDQVATKGAEKHVWDRANCDVAGTCTTAGCTKTVEAGTHTGGTATCKDKAKCAECGKEYGELGACAPAADDGDCTTDIKCSVCGKTTTAGEAAHKYTDKNDTTCDNAGCTNTRKVEGTENPKTGDNTALVLMVALMAVASAAFVTTKKFAR